MLLQASIDNILGTGTVFPSYKCLAAAAVVVATSATVRRQLVSCGSSSDFLVALKFYRQALIEVLFCTRRRKDKPDFRVTWPTPLEMKESITLMQNNCGRSVCRCRQRAFFKREVYRRGYTECILLGLDGRRESDESAFD
eukprot:IDg12215t1